MLHKFSKNISQIVLPEKFTCPFFYEPHELTRLAAEQLSEYLLSRTDWTNELQNGKMFGVLVVRNECGEMGFLAAFSGQIAGKNRHKYFVPPVFDILADRNFFLKDDEVISEINNRIMNFENSEKYCSAKLQLFQFQSKMKDILDCEKKKLQLAKLERDKKRNATNDEQILKNLISESQFQKAEFKRLEKKLKQQLIEYQQIVDANNSYIDKLKQQRKDLSAALQRKIFSQFCFRNANGESKNLTQIFSDCGIEMPPAGAGECAAPRLLQAAYLSEYQPIAMAEFWWGNSPKQEIRRHGNFYPACKHKCEPILNFMLQGLNVEENKLLKGCSEIPDIKTIYEDDFLLIIDKPPGILSVRGKISQPSVVDLIMKNRKDLNELFVVHRLDMATSGLLILAKNIDIFKIMQQQFAERMIKKQYVALLDGEVLADSGTINLPIRADIDNRPKQIVDYKYGKSAITKYEVIERKNGKTRINFYPLTGRTHQLRVHSAHFEGLNIPILGDDLYGKHSERLYLHAERIEFFHPITKQKIVCESKPMF